MSQLKPCKSSPSAYFPKLGAALAPAWLLRDGLWIAIFVIIGAIIRLYRVIDLTSGSIEPCDRPFVDEIIPLVQSKNLLHFDIFFYPPLTPMLVGFLSLPWAWLMPNSFDIGSFCRCVTIAVSLATIPVVYLIGRFWGSRVGLIGAAFFSVNMIASTSTANPQVYSTFFVAGAFYFFLKAYHAIATRNLGLLGLCLGLAITSKYFAAFLGLMLFVGLFSRDRGEFQVDEARWSSHPFLRRTWVLLWGSILFSLGLIAVVGLFQKEFALQLLKGIYDAHPHEHTFDYHLPSISLLYNLALWGMVILEVVVAMLFCVPFVQKLHPWEWMVRLYVRQGAWILPIGVAALTIVVTFGIPILVNLNNYVKYAVFMFKAYVSTDGGMFPFARPAPSYFLAFIPENLGLPLYVLAMVGLCIALAWRDKKVVLILFASLPLYLMLESSPVKVNRYILELIPLLCVCAGFALESLWTVSPVRWSRWFASGIFACVFIVTSVYSLAWANFFRPGRDIPAEAANWVGSHVSQGTLIGIHSSVIVDHVSQYLPNAQQLPGYRLSRYDELPEYLLLPKLVYSVTLQHLNLVREGKGYQDADWFPYPPPTPSDLKLMEEIVSGTRYSLVTEISKQPFFYGWTPGQQSLSGYTWLPEHSSAFSIQVYRKRGLIETHALGVQETR